MALLPPSWRRRPKRTVGDAAERILTRPFVVVLLLAFLGFSTEQMLRPVIPLIIIARGGDVILVGIIAAVPAVPSLLFRPLIGRMVDGPWHGRLLRIGTFLASVAPLGLLLPGLVFLAPARFLHGFAWALYSVSTHALMATLAPAHRRGETSSYFLAMPALATLVGPSIAVALYLAAGEIAPVLVASALAMAATAVALRVRIPTRPSPKLTTGADAAVSQPSRSGTIVERSALPATFMLTTFMAGHSLFAVFPPVYAISVGAPLESLALYYPTYGIVLLLSQVVVGRASDRLGRGKTIRIGCAMAVIGLTVAAIGGGMLHLLVGAVSYAIGVSLVSPTMSAMTIDRSPVDRIGSSMATYSLGYQLATSGSSLLWGAVISAAGFTLAFVIAIGLQIVTVLSSLRYARGF